MIDCAVADIFRKQSRCALIAHIAPDGDTLGSTLALSLALEAVGIKSDLYCEEVVPQIYRLLPGWERFYLPPSSPPEYGLAVAVDVSVSERMGACESIFLAAKETLVLDHHKTNSGFGDTNVIVDKAATAEIILELIDVLGVPLSRDVAVNLYVGLSTDTGNFSYANTTGDALRTAARLVDTGIDVAEITRLVFRLRSLAKTKLIGRAIEKFRFDANGKIAWVYLSPGDYADCGATDEDTEGIINYAIECKDVEIAILARERNGAVKLSLRSSGAVDVGSLADTLGGGGHTNAAGITLSGDVDSVMESVLAAARGVIGA